MRIEVEVRGYFPKNEEKQTILNRIYTLYGKPKISDEVVVFFKYKSDVRIKLNKHGLLFAVKKSVEKEKKHYSRKEYKILIPLEKAEDFIRMLYHMGYEEGLVSSYTKYEFKIGEYCMIIKFGLPVGDVFEIDSEIENPERIEEEKEKLIKIAGDLGLEVFDKKESEEFFNLSAKFLKKEKLLENGEVNRKFKKIIAKYKGSLSRKREEFL